MLKGSGAAAVIAAVAVAFEHHGLGLGVDTTGAGLKWALPVQAVHGKSRPPSQPGEGLAAQAGGWLVRMPEARRIEDEAAGIAAEGIDRTWRGASAGGNSPAFRLPVAQSNYDVAHAWEN